MSLWALTPAKPTIGFTKILAIGALIAAAIVSAPTLLGPAKVGFALCGMLLLIPAVLVRDPRAYGLFLLVVSIPIDVSMHTTKWLAHPDVLFQEFGMPASGTLGVDLYLTDVVLIAMLLPWLAELWRRERELYFPSAAYIAILYFAWALIVSLLEAKSVYLAIFELSRQILYFVFFVYICNNVVTPAQFRAVLMGFFVGLVLESAAVIAFFQLGIGTETDVFSDLLYGSTASPGTLTVAQTGSWSKVSRSAGTFAHPSHAAYYFEYILPTVLACLMTARHTRERIVYGFMMAAGSVGLVMTFSRSGMIGFVFSSGLFFVIARWSRLISQRVFTLCVAIVALLAVMSTPLLIEYLDFRPEAVSIRWRLIEEAKNAFLKEPFTGAGLNNSSAATEGSRAIVLTTKGSSAYRMTVVHNYYLIVLIEVGLIGFALFFGFFWQTVVNAFRYMRAAELQLRLLAAGIVSALAGVAVHNMADPFGGHSNLAMLWLHAGLIFAICHEVRAQQALRTVRNVAPRSPARLRVAGVGTTHS